MSERVESLRALQSLCEAEVPCEGEAVCESQAPAALAEVVNRVLAEVLETMFFAEAVAADCSHAWLSAALGVQIRFAGSHEGEMRLDISLDAADSVACAFLGIELEELTEHLRGQVLLELVNILCGAILSHVWPESKVALRPPELVHAERACTCSPHQCFELPEGNLAVWIQWNETARR